MSLSVEIILYPFWNMGTYLRWLSQIYQVDSIPLLSIIEYLSTSMYCETIEIEHIFLKATMSITQTFHPSLARQSFSISFANRLL